MHQACGDVRRSTELTNALLAGGEAIETNVIADRLVLLHRSIVPAVYDVRRFLGVYGLKRPDPGDVALAELQREFLSR